MNTLTLGEVTISRVVEIGQSFNRTLQMLPDSTAEAIARHFDWLKPHFFDDAVGDLAARIQSFIVRTPQHTVLIDTGVGNDKRRPDSAAWHQRQGAYLADLRAAGLAPEDVDLVLCTHLHVDHVGWNTRLERGAGGREQWVPTFAKATYVFAGEEWEFWRHESESGREASGCIADSVLPVVEAGRARFVSAPCAIDPWLSYEPWVGHTPGHVAVRLRTKAGSAVFAGDLMHRTVQVAEPQWSSKFCYDPARAALTRREFVERHAASGELVLPAHFPHPGRIVKTAAGFRFEPVMLEPAVSGG
jgi:glyoxylase-like metal-dependent hydrolase (beta-lactamase superfamily II)